MPGAPSIGSRAVRSPIARIREHIAAGDTYQVNYTLRLRSQVEGDERGLYRDLCYAQRAAYAAYLNLGRYRVLSASPELFFRIDGDRITTRPMKGTAPRGRWRGRSGAERAARRLREGPRGERDDRGPAPQRPRPDRTNGLRQVDRGVRPRALRDRVAAHVDRVRGARSRRRTADVFRALFPSGSVTGAPKVRSMEIIAGLEDSPRGVYCGAVGVLAPPGHGATARFNVAIRTVTVDSEGGAAEYGVGGGITWDSRAGAEYEETVAKARILTSRRPRFELLETLLHEPGSGFRRLDRHLERLRSSAAYFGFDCDDETVVREALETP